MCETFIREIKTLLRNMKTFVGVIKTSIREMKTFIGEIHEKSIKEAPNLSRERKRRLLER